MRRTNTRRVECKRRTFCVHDGPDAASTRRAAARNGLPVDRVVPVSLLDPHFYR